MNMRSRPSLVLLAALLGCGRGADGRGSEPPHVEVWYHSGQQSERETIRDQVARYNALQDSVEVVLRFLPEGSYNAQVQAAAVAGHLPDLLDLDGPYVASYAWQGHLRPLDGLVADSLVADMLPSIVEQGTYRGDLYALGAFDSGLGLFARRSVLAAVGARIPSSPADAWTVAELSDVMAALAEQDADGRVLDLKLNYDGEWFTYAFLPALISAGGGLIDRDGFDTAAGVLNGPRSRRALETIQGWIASGRVDPNLDDAAFTGGRVALSWSGHWDYPRYAEAHDDDLVVLPLPDFGDGSRTGQGSWVWTIPASSRRPEAAAALLAFLLGPEELLAMAGANGAVPATLTAAARSDLYGEGGPLELFRRQLAEGYAVPRPRTPAYPVLTSVFQEVFAAVRSGQPLRPVLDRAVSLIDTDLGDNRGYPPT